MALASSDLVLDAKLPTKFLDGHIQHTRYEQGLTARNRRIEVHEVWSIGPKLGRGSYGAVRLERLRQPGNIADASAQVRAVKVITKPTRNEKGWDYMKELEAVVKFSNPRYAPYFVRSYGWFEDSDFVYITLEYFPLGDLHKYMKTSSPFSEEETRQIIRQLLEGVGCMHDCGFAHRDLKPANILVQASSPEWLIKIADFGISKRAQDGGTDLRTMHIGTFGYMAPEILGFFQGNDPTVAYSVTVDIWAIGIITVELLFEKHPFANIKEMLDYINGVRPLYLDDSQQEIACTELCKDFLKQLLYPDPIIRPTAGAASNHPWIGIGATPLPEESLFVQDDHAGLPSHLHQPATPSSVPSLAWSNLQLTDGSVGSQATGTLLGTYQGHRLDGNILLPAFRHLSLEQTRYFVLRSDNQVDVETSAAHGIWTSSQRVNKILNKGYLKSAGRVVLFFSVIKSRKFCGVAQMTSELDWINTDEHWLEDNWQGRFTVNWLSFNEVSFDRVKHVPVSEKTPGFRAIACYDGTEISPPSAFELLRAFASEAPLVENAQPAHEGPQ